MTYRSVEKFPTVWQGDVAMDHIFSTLRVTYVSGDMHLALNALPPALFPLCIEPGKTAKHPWQDFKGRKCILTATPDLDKTGKIPGLCVVEAAMYTDLLNFLEKKTYGGAVCRIDYPVRPFGSKYHVSIYLKNDLSASLLSRLAPDWYYTICDKHYLVMIVTEK